jgi:hypothetical protein
VLLVVVLAVLVYGCGGGGHSSTSHTTAAAKSSAAAPAGSATDTAFEAHADGICKRLNATVAAQKVPKLTLAVIARVTPGRALLEHAALKELEHLTPPASSASNWRMMLTARRTLASELAQLGRAAKQGDQERISRLGASKKAQHARLRATASKLGLPDCAES